MAKNTNITQLEKEDTSPLPQKRQSLASIDEPIHFQSLKSSYLADGVVGVRTDKPSKIYGGYYDGVDFIDVLQLSQIYSAYSTFRNRDILILKAYSGIDNGDNILKCISSPEFADYPVYVEHNKQLFPIYGVEVNNDGDDWNTSIIYFLFGQISYEEPKLIDPLLVRIVHYTYKYGSSVKLYNCNSFDTANQLLLQQYHYWKEHYVSEVIPNESSNKWSASDYCGLNGVDIEIINLRNGELAHRAKGMV